LQSEAGMPLMHPFLVPRGSAISRLALAAACAAATACSSNSPANPSGASADDAGSPDVGVSGADGGMTSEDAGGMDASGADGGSESHPDASHGDAGDGGTVNHDASSPPNDAGKPTAACTTLPTPSGTVYYVSPTGGGSGATSGSPTTIDAANQTNATLLLEAGTYAVTSQIGVASGTTWMPAPGVSLGAVVFDGGNDGSLDIPIMVYGATNVTFYGLTFQHMGATWDPNTSTNQLAAIVVQSSANILFDSLSFYDLREVAAVQFNADQNVTASHNAFDTISNRSLSSYTVDFGASCGPYCNQNITFSYNVTTNAVQYGTDVGAYYMDDRTHSATGDVINNNIASGFKAPVPGNASQQVVCIYLDDDQSNTLVENNICYGGAGNYYGTLWHGGDHNTVTNNIFDLTGDSTQIIGLYQDIGNTTNFGMNDNVFSRNVVLTSSGGSLWETCCGSPVALPTLSNNLYWPSYASTGPIVDPSPTVADPRLTNASNPASNAYALSASSPAITMLGFVPIDTSQYGPIPACP
jgi:hypothetical protein